MVEIGWHIEGEMTAGGVWAAVAAHPPVAAVDRTHVGTRTHLGLLMSRERNPTRGRFVAPGVPETLRPLGAIVAIPAQTPLHVRAEAPPARRMLHLSLPADETLPLPGESRLLGLCMDLRNAAIADGLARLAREVIAPGFGSAAIVEGLGLVVAGELRRALTGLEQRRNRGGLAPWQLRRIDDHLEAGHWDASVSSLAALCGVSAGHVMRAFRQSTGRSVAEHIAQARIERAFALLAGDGLAIADVAAELRFASPSGFAAAFRRATGMTPRAYRQRSRGARRG